MCSSLIPRLFVLQATKAVWRPGNEATYVVVQQITVAAFN